MDKQLFVLVTGFPGTGKTTYMKQDGFADAVVLDYDEFAANWAKSCGMQGEDAYNLAVVHRRNLRAALHAEMHRAFRLGQPVVLYHVDYIRPHHRDQLLRAIPENYTKMAVTFDPSDFREMVAAADRSSLGGDTWLRMDRIAACYEEPTLDEGWDYVVEGFDASLLWGKPAMEVAA